MKNYKDTFRELQTLSFSELERVSRWTSFYLKMFRARDVSEFTSPVVFDFSDCPEHVILEISKTLATLRELDQPVFSDEYIACVDNLDFIDLMSNLSFEFNLLSYFVGSFHSAYFYVLVPELKECSNDCMFH